MKNWIVLRSRQNSRKNVDFGPSHVQVVVEDILTGVQISTHT